MTNLEMPVKLTCMFLTVGEPGEHADSTPSHIQSLVFICWQGLEKLILRNNLFKQLNQNLQVSTFFCCLCCLELINSLMYHTDTQTPTHKTLITFRAGSDPQRLPCSVSHCEVGFPCQTAACTSLSLQPSWYQQTEASGQQLPDADAVGVPYRSDSLEPCRFPMTFV